MSKGVRIIPRLDIKGPNLAKGIHLEGLRVLGRPWDFYSGGIRTIEDIKNILRAGADKVAINTAAIKNPILIKEGARTFGSQCIVLSVEAKCTAEGEYEAYIDNERDKGN